MNMHNRLSIRSIVFANCGPMSTNSQHFNTIDVEVCFTRMWDVSGVVSESEDLVGEVNHTTECVTDLFSFWDILFTTESFESYD
jgi:hypothetical protein